MNSRAGDGLTVEEDWWGPPAPPWPIAWWFLWILAGEQSYRAACYGDPLKDYPR